MWWYPWLPELFVGMFFGFLVTTRFFWRNLFRLIRWLFTWIFSLIQRRFFPELNEHEEDEPLEKTLEEDGGIQPKEFYTAQDLVKMMNKNKDLREANKQ